MELRRVRYFLAVAEHENFRRAAEAMHVAQSALSRHVATLEAEIGATLLERFPRGVRLTPVGRVFAEEARRGVAAMERAFQRARRAADGALGRLTVGMNDIAARNRLVGARVEAFRQAFPDIDFEFELMVSRDQIVALQAGRIDLGIMIERPERAELRHLTVACDPFMLALPRGHPLAESPVIRIGELVDEPFVTVKLSNFFLPQTRLLARCRTLGLVPLVVMETSNDQMQLNFIAAGTGVGFVNGSALGATAPDVVLRPVEGLDISLDVDLVWMRDAPAIERFVEMFPPIDG